MRCGLTFMVAFALLVWTHWTMARADLLLTGINTPETITFTGFDGSGFSPGASSGQLDSDTWRVTGFSDGDGSFGGTHTTGDFARGASSGGVTQGGIYAFNTGGTSGVGLGVQPTGSDFTPGTITLRLKNDTGVLIEDLEIAYDVFIYNDQNRSNSFNFQYSADDTSYTPVSSLNLASPEGADSSPIWARNSLSATLKDVNIAPNAQFYLQWIGDDISGSGARDEFALDNIDLTPRSSVSAVPEPSTGMMVGLVTAGLLFRRRR